MKPKFFPSPSAWHAWLDEHHEKQDELLVGFYKVGSGKASITWPEAVDGALCFGWIDGVRKSLGESSYVIRFTPRRAKSVWSAVNIKRVAELSASGLMRPGSSSLRATYRKSLRKSTPTSKEKAPSSKAHMKSSFVPTRKPGNSFRRSRLGTRGPQVGG